jgi:hypothetical protein
MKNLENHPNWIGNVVNYSWKPRTSAFHDLINSQGKLITVMLFGKVVGSRVGIYGDFNELYHQSLLSPGIRNLTWKISAPSGYVDAFYTQFLSLQKIESALDQELEPSQRSAKSANEIELKRKIAKKVDTTQPVVPVDKTFDFWKKYCKLIYGKGSTILFEFVARRGCGLFQTAHSLRGLGSIF